MIQHILLTWALPLFAGLLIRLMTHDPSSSSTSSSTFSHHHLSAVPHRQSYKYPTPGVYPCSRCGRIYRHPSSMYKHRRLECGIEPQYPCPYCPGRFKRPAARRRHVETVHRESEPLKPGLSGRPVGSRNFYF